MEQRYERVNSLPIFLDLNILHRDSTYLFLGDYSNIFLTCFQINPLNALNFELLSIIQYDISGGFPFHMLNAIFFTWLMPHFSHAFVKLIQQESFFSPFYSKQQKRALMIYFETRKQMTPSPANNYLFIDSIRNNKKV